MKGFSYSLQKILDLRDFERRQAESELGKVNARIAEVQRQLRLIAERRLATQRRLDADSHDTQLLADGHGYMVFLSQKKDACLARLAELELEAEQKKELVRRAMQKEKVLEKLKESRFSSWKAEYLREEELALDDVVTAKYGGRASSAV